MNAADLNLKDLNFIIVAKSIAINEENSRKFDDANQIKYLLSVVAVGNQIVQ